MAYVLANIVQASLAVFARAINGIMVGDKEPRMALKRSWSCLIQSVCAGFGVVVPGRIVVGQGYDPSMNPRRSYPIKRV